MKTVNKERFLLLRDELTPPLQEVLDAELSVRSGVQPAETRSKAITVPETEAATAARQRRLSGWAGINSSRWKSLEHVEHPCAMNCRMIAEKTS